MTSGGTTLASVLLTTLPSASRQSVTAMMPNVPDTPENRFKLGLYLAALEQGHTPAEAAAVAQSAWERKQFICHMPVPLAPVRDFVRTVLSTFIEERLQRFPDNSAMAPFLQQGKAHLVISHDACEAFMRVALKRVEDPFFGALHAALPRSPLRSVQRYFCTLQLIHAYQRYVMNPSGLKSWFYLVSEGACDIYGQSYDLCVRLVNNACGGLGGEPVAEGPMRAARFADHALRDLFAELQCGNPHPHASIAALRVFEHLYGGSIENLEPQDFVQIGEWLIANNWEIR